MSYPNELFYTPDHVWIKENGDTVLIGITDFAQDQLGEILFVDLPEAGKAFEAGKVIIEIESQKTSSELTIPFGCEIVAVNEELDDSPELINEDAYANWIAELKISEELTGLLNAADYEAGL